MTLKFLHNLLNGSTTVRGRDLTVVEAVIAKVTRILTEGTKWTEKHILLHNVVVVFQDPNEKLARTGKGIHPSALRWPWQELEVIVQWYITCDGRWDVVKPRQLKLLNILK